MTTAAALSLSLVAISALVAGLGLAIVCARIFRRALAGRQARRTAEARPVLVAMLAEEDPAAAQQAMTRLLALDDATWAALEPRVTQLLGKVRGSAHDLLRTLVVRRGTVERARRRTRRMGAVGRARAAEVLGGLADPDLTPDLVRLLADRDPEVRQVAARALGRSGDPRAAVPLLACVSSGDVPPRVVSQALLRLGGGAEPHLIAALSDGAELTRAVAVEILGLTSAVGGFHAVRQCLTADPSDEVRIRAARSLGRVGLPSALGPLLAATDRHQPESLRAVAARALGELGHHEAVPRLQALLRDPAHRVAFNAGRSLVRLGPPGLSALRREILLRPGGPGAAHARDALSRTTLGAGDRPADEAQQRPDTAVGAVQ